jgi:hypothetical protein
MGRVAARQGDIHPLPGMVEPLANLVKSISLR